MEKEFIIRAHEAVPIVKVLICKDCNVQMVSQFNAISGSFKHTCPECDCEFTTDASFPSIEYKLGDTISEEPYYGAVPLKLDK